MTHDALMNEKVIMVISASYHFQYLCKGEEKLHDVCGDYK
jgi:hypothetical protein